MELPKDQPNQLNIEISEEVSEGVYANLATVMPITPKSKVKPGNLKMRVTGLLPLPKPPVKLIFFIL